ncbi:MAG TPA: serine hydrolase [Longimicrobium sp.]
MRFLILAILPALAIMRAVPSSAQTARASPVLAITDVTVVDVANATLRPHQTVVTAGGRIRSIGPTGGRPAIPRGASVVRGTGKYLIPGLWDMHVHLTAAGATDIPLFVAHGVTGVRDMGGTWEVIQRWRHAIDVGTVVGPRVRTAGPIIENARWLQRVRSIPEGAAFLDAYPRFGVSTVEEAKSAVDSLARLGVDFIKVRNAPPDEAYLALLQHARSRGLSVVGHAPGNTSGFRRAIDAGQAGIEHLDYLADALDSLSAAERHSLFAGMARHSTRYTPTIVSEMPRMYSPAAMTAAVNDSLGRLDPRRRYVSDVLLQFWRTQEAFDKYENPRNWSEIIPRELGYVREIHQAGVTFLAGTDFGTRLVYPGWSLHDELALLVERASLSPAEALQAATINAASFFNEDRDFGTVEVGRRADLVLLDANPLEQIRNTRRINAVILAGRLLDRAQLDRLEAAALGSRRHDERASAAPRRDTVRPGTIPSELRQRIPYLMTEGIVPGLAVALVEGARPAWLGGFGVTNAETRTPVSAGTVFEAASLGKPVFAYAVLKLADRAVLDLDAPLSRYLPQPYVAGDERLHRITARSVLAHSTGLPNSRRGGEPLRISFEPGERFSYSGEGYLYLQKVVEGVTGLGLDSVMKELVFKPLGMEHSSYVWRPEYDRLKAYGHGPAGELSGRGRSNAANAAASLETTAADYARFVAAVMRGEGLTPAASRALLSPWVRVDAGCAVCIGHAPGASHPNLAWGMGWGLDIEGPDTLFWHWGDNGDMKSFVMGSRNTGKGVVLFANSANGLAIAQEIVRVALGRESHGLFWLDYQPYTAPSRQLLRQALSRGESVFGGPVDVNAADLVGVGERLLRAGRLREARAAYLRALRSDSISSTVHRGLAEALRRLGDRSGAATHYRRAVQLHANDPLAAELLAILEAPEVHVPAWRLGAYQGSYNTPLGVLTVSSAAGRLYARLGEAAANELLPRSVDRFYVEGVGADITFVAGPDRHVTHANVRVGGQELRADRIQ